MKFYDDTQDFEQPPAKTYQARLVSIYDIGVQAGVMYQGKMGKDTPKMIWGYELLGKDKKLDGSNFVQNEFITVSLHAEKATLPKRLSALGVKLKLKSKDWFEVPDIAGNLAVLLGEPVMVEIVHDENGKASIGNVMAPIDGMTISNYTVPLQFLDLDSPDYLDSFNKAPKWIQGFCEKSIGWDAR